MANCMAGTCGYDKCNGGFGDCDNKPSNGCETSTSSSNTHCGACNNTCKSNKACINGVCLAKNCKELFDGGQKTNGSYTIDPDGNGLLPSRSVYCDMSSGGHTLFRQQHNWGEWGSNMNIVMRDRLTAATGNATEWNASCALFGKVPYVGKWKNTGATYSLNQYQVFADAKSWWENHAKKVFPSVTHNDIVILHDSVTSSCWGHYAETGSLQCFGSPTGSGFAFCRNGQLASKRYHIYLCKP